MQSFIFSEDEGVTMVNSEGEFVYIAEYTRIPRVYILSNNSQLYEVEFMHKFKNTREKIVVPYTTIINTGIISLMEYGVDVNDKNKANLSNALIASLDQAEVIFILSNYGFDHFENLPVFVGNKIHSTQPLNKKIEIKHDKFDLQPRGNADHWFEMYTKHVQNHPELELAIAIGASAPVLAYLGKSRMDLKNMLIHLSGASSSGKTTALILAISMAGNPNSESNSLFRSWNGTTNSIMSSLEGLFGFPIAFDELSMNQNQNLTSLAYSITEGIGKARSNIDGTLQQNVGSWRTTVLSSGELSIFNRLNHNVGLKIRVFDFQNIQWTDSAEQAEAIKNVCYENYGHFYSIFLDKLFETGLSIINETYKEEKKRLFALFPSSSTKQRTVNKVAVLTTTVQLINQLNILKMDIDEVTQFLIHYEEKQIEGKDLAFLALDKLMQYLLSHKGQISLFSRNSIGYLEGNYVCIYREKLKHILNNLDFEDHEIIIKSWIDSGIIQSSENDRITTRKVKDGKRFISYKIKIPEEYKAVLTKEFHKNGHTFRAY